MRIYALYFASCGHNGIIGASASAKFDVGALPAFPVHIILELVHKLPCFRLGKIILAGVVTDIAHNIFWHAYEAIAGINIAIWPDRKGASHTIHECADRAPPREIGFAQVIDIHDLDLAQVFQIFIHEIYQQFSIFFRVKRPFFRFT